MDPDLHLSHLIGEHEVFRACLDEDLTAPVKTCGDWNLRDLAEHLGQSNMWVATAVTEGHGDYPRPPAPAADAAFLEWFDGTVDALVSALSADPDEPAWTFAPPGTVGFWRRRRALETLVHRWDAELALGATGPLDPELSGDGIAEVFEVMAPRQIVRGRASFPRGRVAARGDRPGHGVDVRARRAGRDGVGAGGGPAAVVVGAGFAGGLQLGRGPGRGWGRVGRAVDGVTNRTPRNPHPHRPVAHRCPPPPAEEPS